MKELNLCIKLKEDGKKNIYVVDKHMNILEDQNKLKGQLMFEEPKLMSTIMETFKKRDEICSYAEPYREDITHLFESDYKLYKIMDEIRAHCKVQAPMCWLTLNEFPEVIKEELNKVLTTYKINMIYVDWGIISDRTPNGWITCTPVVIRIPRGSHPELREMPDLKTIGYKIEEL